MNRSRNTAVLVITAAVLTAACGPKSHDDLLLGVRAVAIDLSFENPKLAEPVSPQTIIKVIPAPPQLVSGQTQFANYAGPVPATPVPSFPSCPTAPAGATPKGFATVDVKAPPAPGAYGRHNKGNFKVTGGPVTVTLPYPFFTTDTISASKDVTPTDPINTTFNTGPVSEYDIVNQVTPTISTTTTYHLTTSAIQIVKEVIKNGASTTTFAPSPPLDFVQLNNGEGHTWHTAGVDTANNTAEEIEGAIKARVPVDVCGTLVDSYRVELTETMVNLATGETSGTTDQPNVYWVATQLGGLIVSTEQHSTVRATDPTSGSAITVQYNYTSTVNKTTPSAGQP